MKFTREECMQKSDCRWSDLDSQTQKNADEVIRRVNALGCSFPRLCSSFVRSKARQIDIYRNKAALKMFPFTDGTFVLAKVPLRSKHITGEAIDVADTDGKLKAWVRANIAKLEEDGLWCEDFAYTDVWVHFQIAPPKSGKRFFIP